MSRLIFHWIESFTNHDSSSGKICNLPRTVSTSFPNHYSDVTMSAMASQIISLRIVYSAVYSGADQRKQRSFASLAFVWGIHRGPVNSPHKWPVTRKMFPFDDIIMGHRSDSLVGVVTRLSPRRPFGFSEPRSFLWIVGLTSRTSI